jgi:hypothetical protein
MIAFGRRDSAAHMTRRTSGCSTSSPQRSACSTSRRSRPSAGSSGGSGARCSSERTISREPSTFSPSSKVTAGTVEPPKRLRCWSLATTGIMSTRSYATPFNCSATSIAAHGCEAGRA